MRKALVVLVVLTAVLAFGLVAVAFVNQREARVLTERTVEMRAFDQATGLVRRLAADRPRDAADIRAALDDLIGDEVLYAAVALSDGRTLLAAGPAPAFDPGLAREAAARTGAAPRSFARREATVSGQPVVEFAVAAPAGGRRLGGAGAGRVWREFVADRLGGASRGPGPPILRLGIRLDPLSTHLHRARLVLLLSLIVAPFLVAAAVVAAWSLGRATRMREEAGRRARLASLGELAATVAHEIRNPLGAIKGYAQLVEEGAGGDAARRAATTMREECVRLERTVTQVLGYARDAQPRLETADLREALDAELARHADAAAAKGVRIVRDYGGERVEARVDSDQLARAVANLVDNALAASPADGRVIVALRPERRQVEVVVADEGPGVAPEDRERIFEPFVSQRPGGTGLGLALVRRIAEAHGGSVRVEARTGGGAEFVVRLPR